jgi:ATP-dependent RNA helicase RhlE
MHFRAVEYALTAANVESLSYHGDLNSKERESNLEQFREGKLQYLVCTDIAARGIDIPEVS